MITLFAYPQSRATRITWLLEELGQEFEYKLIDFAKGESQSKEYLTVNPSGKVPAIKDDELVMIESGAIANYLADKHSAAGLIPAVGTAQRAMYEQWSYFVLCELEQPLWTMGKHKFALPEEQRVAAILPTAVWEFKKALNLLSKGLADNDYLLGATFSAVDILAAHTLFWALAFKQPIEQENLQAYIDRLKQRPALLRAQQRERAEAEKRGISLKH